MMPNNPSPRMPTPAKASSTAPRRPAPRSLRARRIALWSGVAVVGVMALAAGKFWSTMRHLGGGNATDMFASIRNPRGQFPGKNRVNVLLIGKDYSYQWTKRDVKLNGARYSTESRSDTIMMLSLDLDTKKVSALSIPRDTWVTAPDGKTGKINAVIRRGGPQMLEATVAKMLGVAPDYYIAVQPDSVKAVVDKLGGVEVETLDAMEYNDAAAGLHINLPKGQQVINGTAAIGFARFREADIYERQPNGQPIFTGRKDGEGNPIFVRRQVVIHSQEEGDPRRMARQQQLIRAMAASAKSPSNWMRLGDVVETALGQLETDLPRPQMLALVALFRNTAPDQMQSGTLSGKGVKGSTYYFLPDERRKQAMVEWLLKGDESAADRLTVVAVQNGTAIHGAARRIADQLRLKGFDAKPDNTPPTALAASNPAANATTRIVYGKAAAATRAQRIAQLLGVPANQVTKEVPVAPSPDSSPTHRGKRIAAADQTADVTVILGQDLAGVAVIRSAQR